MINHHQSAAWLTIINIDHRASQTLLWSRWCASVFASRFVRSAPPPQRRLGDNGLNMGVSCQCGDLTVPWGRFQFMCTHGVTIYKCPTWEHVRNGYSCVNIHIDTRWSAMNSGCCRLGTQLLISLMQSAQSLQVPTSPILQDVSMNIHSYNNHVCCGAFMIYLSH